MNDNKKSIVIQMLAIFGIVLSVELAYIYYTANFDKYSLSSFCSVNDFIDCDGTARTRTAQFLGIPLAYWGLFFYLTVLFLTFVEKLKTIKFLKFLEVFKNPNMYIVFLSTIAFVVSMFLAGISLFKIHKICVLCLATYFIDLFIAFVAANMSIRNVFKSFIITFVDIIDGAKIYTKTFIVLTLCIVGFLTYSGISLNFVPHIKKSNSILKYQKIKYNPYRVSGNTLGNPNGKIVIDLYSDYVCPMCYIHNIMLHQAVKEYKNIKINHHNLPFDKECNGYITINMHPRACFMSRAAIAARKQNNYWEMSSLLYENQPRKISELDDLINKLNFDKEQFYKDLNSEETSLELKNEIKNATYYKNIDATPTMFINGKKYVGIKPYYDLKKILEENGARK